MQHANAPLTPTGRRQLVLLVIDQGLSFEAAAAALSRVRLDGPFTTRALLGLGWAETDAEHPDRALVPWLALRDRPLPTGQRPNVHGDHTAVAAMRGWTLRAQGL